MPPKVNKTMEKELYWPIKRASFRTVRQKSIFHSKEAVITDLLRIQINKLNQPIH